MVEDSEDEEAAEESGNEEAAEKPEADDVKLESMFKVGQYLRAYVLHSTEDVDVKGAKGEKSASKTRKRIELSIDPKVVNTGLTSTDLIVGTTVQASVLSVEDHGLVMDLGMDGDLKGFLSSKELGPKLSIADAKEGQVLFCTVTGMSSNAKIVKLSADLEQKFSKKGKLAGGKASWWLGQAPSIDAFLPGTGVEVLVTEVGKQGGVVGTIMGMLDAVADYFHVAGWDQKDLEDKVKPGSKVNISKSRSLTTALMYITDQSQNHHPLSQLRPQEGHFLDSPPHPLFHPHRGNRPSQCLPHCDHHRQRKGHWRRIQCRSFRRHRHSRRSRFRPYLADIQRGED